MSGGCLRPLASCNYQLGVNSFRFETHFVGLGSSCGLSFLYVLVYPFKFLMKVWFLDSLHTWLTNRQFLAE